MGIGCVLLLWAAVGAIAVLAFLIGVVLIWRGWRVTGGALAIGGLIAAIGAAVFIASWIWASFVPQNDSGPAPFRAEFGIEPADVTGIRAQLTQSTDFQRRVMRFHASPAAIAQITRTKFKPAPLTECDGLRHFDNAPEWWTPRGSACFTSDPYDDAFTTSSRAWLLYDESSRDAHFAYVGID